MIGKKAISQFHNQIIHMKKIYLNKKPFFMRLWNASVEDVFTTLNEIRLYVISRNVRTVVASSVRKDADVSIQHSAECSLQSKKFLYFVLHRQKPDMHSPVSAKILKFHLQDTLLENFFLKYSKKLLSLTKKAVSKEDLEKQWGGPEAYKLITFIKDDFKEVVNKHPSILIFFSAEWCHHCLRLRTPYGTAALMAKEANLPVVFATFDVTSDPDIADENGVVGIPTIKYYQSGKIVSTFRGKRTADDLLSYVKNPVSNTVESKKADV